MALAPEIDGAGVALIIVAKVEVLVQIPFEVTKLTKPDVPVPHTIDTNDVVAEPLMVPPVTVQA